MASGFGDLNNTANSRAKFSKNGPLDLLPYLQTAVLLLDRELRICFMNEAAEALFQSSISRATGEPFSSLIYLDAGTSQAVGYSSHPLMDELRNALRDIQPFTQREATLEVFGVGQLTVDYFATPLITDEPRDVANYLLMEFLPIDRKLNIGREEARLNSQETTRMLIRGLAHEVKNPLGGIRGSAQLLEAELSDPQLKEYTQVVIEEADRLRNLVDRLLGPNQPPRFEPTNIHRVLEHVTRLCFAELATPPDIVREYDPSIPKLDADYDQLIQAFLNVLRNALQALAGRANPQIRLRTQTLRRFTIGDTNHRLVARVDIEDNGPGIPDQISDRLFYPMISGRADGSGLGLSITQTIIGQHNGLIAVESEPGCTRFSFYLPLRQRPEDCNGFTHASHPSVGSTEKPGSPGKETKPHSKTAPS